MLGLSVLALAVRFQAYDYRSFFRLLLGRAWFLFELVLMVLFVLVLAVMGSAAGGILQDSLGLPAEGLTRSDFQFELGKRVAELEEIVSLLQTEVDELKGKNED